MENELIKAAVEAGDVIVTEDVVKISEKASPTGKAAEKKYQKFTAVTPKGMAALCGGKFAPATAKPEGEDTRTEAETAPGACDYFNYGFDLDARAQVRTKLMSELEGPEKSIAKAVKALVENAGFSEAAAREVVILQRKAQGLPV